MRNFRNELLQKINLPGITIVRCKEDALAAVRVLE
jgi:hypothetical protein